MLHYPQENRLEPFHKHHSPLANQMEHIDSKKDRIITHKSFDPLFFHFSPNKTLWQNYTFKGTTSSRTIATWLPFVSHPLFRIFSWQRLFHYFATWIEANPSSSEASQRFWGSYCIFGFSKLMLNFTSFPLNYFQLTWIHHIVHKKIQVWWEDAKRQEIHQTAPLTITSRLITTF